MEDSEDDWSLHEIDRVQEESPAPLSPRGGASAYHHETRGGGRRFNRRAWGSAAAGLGAEGAAGASPPTTPPSLNLEAVMSFPPMSEEHLALSQNERLQPTRRRRSSSSSFTLNSEPQTLLARNPAAAAYLHGSSISQSSAGQTHSNKQGTGSFGGLMMDESISEHVVVEGDEEEEDTSVGQTSFMAVNRQRDPARSTNPRHHHQSVITGLTGQQRSRFEDPATDKTPSSPRSRFNTDGSASVRSRVYLQESVETPTEKHNTMEMSESSERPPESRRRTASIEIASDSSWIDETEHGGAGDDDTEGGDSTTVETRKAIVLWGGLELPRWLISWFPSLHRISTIVVTRAPCFIWWGFRQPTDRTILTRLNILVSFVTTLQIAATIFLAAVSWNRPELENLPPTEEEATDNRGPILFNVWTTNVYIYLTGMFSFINFSSAFLTIRVIRNVNLVGAIRYLWVLLWVLPLQFQANIGLFDYFRVTDVWIKHYWRDSTMSWFRGHFCDPSDTADRECTVPFSDNATETQWCVENYNSTDCSSIRNSAQSEMETWILGFYYINASVGLLLICLVVLAVNVLEHIISKPLVQKSRESNVPAWMSLPIVCCVVYGLVFSFSESSVLNTRTQSEGTFIGPLFLAAAGLFLLAAIIGWFISTRPVMSTRHKRNKLISIWAFVVLMLCIIVLLATIFATCIGFSVSFVDVPISESERGDIACFLENSRSCTRCEEEVNRCPEWSKEDVTKVIQTQAKASASLAAMLMLYAFSALRFGIGLRTATRLYQIEYV